MPVTVGGLPVQQLQRVLMTDGLVLRTGPFVFRIRSPHRVVADGLAAMYADYAVMAPDALADFSVEIADGVGLHRFVRRQARFVFDGRPVFEPLPAAHGYALLEWAMNWCISTHAHQYLIVHAAAIERGGGVAILPAPPGSGKSTLCAGLINSGWRLLSDELSLIDMRDGLVWPLCRPVGLKNASIEVIGRFAPGAQFSAVTHDTAKGRVSHLRVRSEDLSRVDVPARARWIIYPRFVAGGSTEVTRRSRASSLVDLARNAFNFSLQGEAGFDRLCHLVQDCECADFSYGDLHDAARTFAAMAEQ